MKENNEKKMKDEDEISKLIKAFPKDIAALDKRSVLAKVNSQGSGRQKLLLGFQLIKCYTIKWEFQIIEKLILWQLQLKEMFCAENSV